jgi:hypothetical protein
MIIIRFVKTVTDRKRKKEIYDGCETHNWRCITVLALEFFFSEK